MDESVKTITHPDGHRRVELFRRANGTFGFEESVWDDRQQSWHPVGAYADSFTETLEAAEREARARVAWLADSTG